VNTLKELCSCLRASQLKNLPAKMQKRDAYANELFYQCRKFLTIVVKIKHHISIGAFYAKMLLLLLRSKQPLSTISRNIQKNCKK